MEEVNYEFRIGDTVRVRFCSFNDVCIVQDRQPRGGGCDSKEPLYTLYYAPGFPSYAGIVGLGDNNHTASFHSQFLTLEQAYIPDEEFDVSDLI